MLCGFDFSCQISVISENHFHMRWCNFLLWPPLGVQLSFSAGVLSSPIPYLFTYLLCFFSWENSHLHFKSFFGRSPPVLSTLHLLFVFLLRQVWPQKRPFLHGSFFPLIPPFVPPFLPPFSLYLILVLLNVHCIFFLFPSWRRCRNKGNKYLTVRLLFLKIQHLCIWLKWAGSSKSKVLFLPPGQGV